MKVQECDTGRATDRQCSLNSALLRGWRRTLHSSSTKEIPCGSLPLTAFCSGCYHLGPDACRTARPVGAQLLSGHTLEHLVAALAAWPVLSAAAALRAVQNAASSAVALRA